MSGGRRVTASSFASHDFSGVDVEFSVAVSLGSSGFGASDDSVEIAVKGDVAPLSVQAVVQVLDPEGHEVVGAVLGEAVDVAPEISTAASAATLSLPSLPDGYYAIQATVLGVAIDAEGAAPDSEDEHTGVDRTYVHSVSGELTEVSYTTWFFEGGAGSVTGPA